MKEQGIFVPIEEAKVGLRHAADGAPLKFGTREVLFKNSDEVKSGRRMIALLSRLQADGIFPQDATFGEQALLHGENGDPTFIEMQYPDQSRWFVSARPVLYDGHSVRKDKIGEHLDTENLDIVTGVCLFGAHSVEANGKSGRLYQITDPATLGTVEERLDKVSVDPWIHPYEVDTVLRLNQFIETSFKHSNPKVNYHIPRNEYYLFGRLLQSRGFFNKEQVDEWGSTVDRRANGIQRLIEKRSTKEVRIINPLAPAEDYIKGADKVSVEGVVGHLGGDAVWRELLEENPPHGLLDINYLSYIHAYLSTARGEDNNLANHSQNRLVVAVENPEEAKILVQAQQHIEAIGKPATIVGLYVHPRVLTKHETGKKQILYYHPNHDGQKVNGLVQIYRQYAPSK